MRRKLRIRALVVASTLALSGEARAQFGVPGLGSGGLGGLAGGAAAPIAAPIGGVASAVPTAAAAPRTLWSFLGLSKDNLAACKSKLCGSQLGQMMNSGLGPIGGLTGGIIPPLCPPNPSASDLAAAMAEGGPVGTAAEIKAEMAAAKAKIAAIAYLATVDCGVWPEAEKTLIAALRSERVECVRYAAAKALGTGCCCTEKTSAALTKVLNGSTEDGGILERSERVKAASYLALCHCVGKYIPKPKRRPEAPAAPRRPESPPPPMVPFAPTPASAAAAGVAGNDDALRLTAYYDHIEQYAPEQIMAEARAAIVRWAGAPWGFETMPTGTRSLFQALARASSPPGSAFPTSRAITTGKKVKSPQSVAFAAPVPPPIEIVPRPRSLTLESDADPIPPPIPSRLPDGIKVEGGTTQPPIEATPPESQVAPPIPRSLPGEKTGYSAGPIIPRTLPLRVPTDDGASQSGPATRTTQGIPGSPVGSPADEIQAPAPVARRDRSLLDILAASRRPRPPG